MELYYRNETLFIDVTIMMDDKNINDLKKKIFRIIDDYDIDHIIIQSSSNNIKYKKLLQQIKYEYNQKYHGYFLIR